MLRYRPTRRSALPRARLLALILGAAGLSLLLAAGLTLSVCHLLHPAPAAGTSRGAAAPARPAPVNASVARARDALAAAPMPDTPTGHEFGWPQLSTRKGGPAIELPQPQGVDGLGVANGFGHTDLGALAQLVAIDTVALRSASLPGVRAVITAWAAPGGPSATTWSVVAAMASLLESADMPGTGSPHFSIEATAAMGLIKGHVGDDFVVACVDFSVDITDGPATTTTASADCERMLWQQGRWVIGPGPEPAAPVQVWPDTDAAIDAGFRDLAGA
jgi:hypothetical protein